MGVEQDTRHHRSISARIGSGRCGDSKLIAEPGQGHAHGAEREIAGRLKQHAVEQCHVDVLSFTGRVAMVQGCEGRQGAMESREVVGEKGRRFHRLAFRVSWRDSSPNDEMLYFPIENPTTPPRSVGKSSIKQALEVALTGSCEGYRKRNYDQKEMIHDLGKIQRFDISVDLDLGALKRGRTMDSTYLTWQSTDGT